MKARENRFVVLVAFFGLLLFAAATFAQSGKIAASPMPPAEPAKLSDEKSKFIRDPNADKYKLVFPTSYEGVTAQSVKKVDWKLESARASYAEELKKAGAQGYKFVAATGDNLFTLMRLDEVPHEYQWFETAGGGIGNGSGIDAADFAKKHDEMQRQGFKLVDNHLLVGGESCVTNTEDNIITNVECFLRYLFLYEREAGATKPVRQFLAAGVYGVGERPSVGLVNQINEKLAEGFYPIKTFSGVDVLLEQVRDKEDLAGEKPEVQIIRSLWGRAVTEYKVNFLAKQGFRVATANTGIAVLYRHNKSDAPASYVWLMARRKNFERKLAELEKQNAIYRTVYPNIYGDETALIFEIPQTIAQTKREYKTLKFDFELTPNPREGKVTRDLTAQSKETLKTLNNLAKQGFEARELFVSGSDANVVTLLLERLR